MSVDGDDELGALKKAAVHAYERVRLEVIDQFPAGVHIRESELTPSQLEAMRDLYQADAALEAYRQREHRADPPQ